MNSYDKGDVVRCRGAFTSRDLTAAEEDTFRSAGTLPAGIGLDPTAVNFKFETPAGVATTRTYPTNVTKVETGSYYSDVDANANGQWWHRFDSTGSGQAAAEQTFYVKSEFA